MLLECLGCVLAIAGFLRLSAAANDGAADAAASVGTALSRVDHPVHVMKNITAEVHDKSPKCGYYCKTNTRWYKVQVRRVEAGVTGQEVQKQ